MGGFLTGVFMSDWVRRAAALALGGMLSVLSACGGGGGGGGDGAAEPAPPPATRATTEGIWGVVVNGEAQAVLIVPRAGPVYGALVSDGPDGTRYEVLRGTLPGLAGMILTSNFVAVGVTAPGTRELTASGTFEPMHTMDLTIRPDNRVLNNHYDASYDQHIPLARQAGTYEAILVSGGLNDTYELQLAPTGVVAMRGLVPGFESCEASGVLQPQSGTTGVMDVTLTFTGDSCLIADGMQFIGHAQYDPVTGTLTAFAMDEAATAGLILYALP